ncbi:MAG: cell surface protein SprA [Ignavibacteriales bacterium]|nr:cell surface protein SprA [Ignavibacteriales bacterium]
MPLALLFAQVPPPVAIPSDTTIQQDTSLQKQIPVKPKPDTAKIPTKVSTPDSLESIREWMRTMEDSTALLSDTLFNEEEEEWQTFHDSTARVSQWIHYRQDDPMVAMFPRSKYSLYLDVKSPAYKRELKIDSSGQYVTVREMVNNIDVKVPVTLSLEEYIQQRYEYEKINGWRSLSGQYAMKQDKDDLSGLLKSITNISIPVPANPLTNIFGGNEINLKISGGVDIRAAFRNTKSDQMTISQYDRSRNEPDFNQNVQINVNGTIGKKLNILADWNTQRTFEYENQLKIKYTGFEDEIIQSIEAGNVSLQTPSLVGGGAALFGIKAKLQTGPLMLTTLLSQKKGQTKEITVSGGATSSEKEIRLHKYSQKHFFLDTVYIKFFEDLHRETVPTITPEMNRYRIEQIDVWLSTTSNQAMIEGKAKYAKAYIDLPSRPYDVEYTEEQLNSLSTESDRYYQGNFVWLDPSKDYTYDQYGGYITLLATPNDEQAIAVAYTVTGIGDRETYGESSEGADTIHLKLIKPKFLFNKPNNKPAWDLLMKNFYSVEVQNLKKDGFELSVWRQTEGVEIDDINGISLLSILGLDRYSQNGESKPDNSFDFIPNVTVDTRLGEIIFPTL